MLLDICLDMYHRSTAQAFPYLTFYLHCVMLKLSFNFEMLCDRIALEICHFLGSLDIIIWCSAFMPKVLLMVAITLCVTSRLLILSDFLAATIFHI